MEPHLQPPGNLEVDWRDLIGRQLDLLVSRSDDILSSLGKLGELLSICVIFAEIEPIIRERAVTLAMQHKEIPGWTLVHRDGQHYVEAASVAQACLQCPLSNLKELLLTMSGQLGNVSEARYRTICESAGVTIQAEAIKQNGATVFLRRNLR